MDDLISRQAALDALGERPMVWTSDDDYSLGERNQYDIDRLAIETVPSTDVVAAVRCKDCKHRILNEHYGEKGYLNLKAMCELDSGDPFELGRCAENGDWFCADGERKDG